MSGMRRIVNLSKCWIIQRISPLVNLPATIPVILDPFDIIVTVTSVGMKYKSLISFSIFPANHLTRQNI